ncbi:MULTISPECIES: SH3 domain-containing protein [Serratia]|uniref:SH3 domain-containing protein n=1 Tax=Serratia TaxID=613 RepID=UPI00351BF3C4
MASFLTGGMPGCEVSMLYVFPADTFGVAIDDYARPYENPISVAKGDVVRPCVGGSMSTDFMGWTWCIGSDGRAGWTPDSWCDVTDEGWRLKRDFSALELTVRKGDRLLLLFSESGFVFSESSSGERAWVPDAVLALETTSCVDIA